jgi:Lysyl oxidase
MARPRTRTRQLPRFAGRRVAAGALALILGLSLAPTRQPALAATDRLPDLRVAPLADFRITTENGRRLLRFTAMMVNVGQGHFELRGQRDSLSDPTMSINQVIYNSTGGSRQVATDAEGRYSGDGHDHWHVQQMMSYSLWPVAGPTSFLRGAKVGFCFLDTDPWNLSLPGARQSSYYRNSWCGTQATLSNRVGISLGWGDKYRWSIAFQWIDITGLAAGDYYVRTVVDEPNHFVETNNANNCTWIRIRIPATGTTVQGISSGATCLAPASATTFAGMITYAQPRRINFAAGEHVGYRFAQNGTVIATFPVALSRASGADAARSAPIPGQTGTWFYVVNGIWAGYWLRESSAVVGTPLPAAHVAFAGTSGVPATSRVNLAAGGHYGYHFAESGATIASKWYPLGTASGANVDRRGTVPSHPGTWVHVSNGIWAGYWIRESERAVFRP